MKIFAVLLLVLSVVCYADTPEEKPNVKITLTTPIYVRHNRLDVRSITSIMTHDIDALRDKPISKWEGKYFATAKLRKFIEIEG